MYPFHFKFLSQTTMENGSRSPAQSTTENEVNPATLTTSYLPIICLFSVGTGYQPPPPPIPTPNPLPTSLCHIQNHQAPRHMGAILQSLTTSYLPMICLFSGWDRMSASPPQPPPTSLCHIPTTQHPDKWAQSHNP